MIKLLIMMAFGKKIKQTKLVTFMIKAYLLFYMITFPVTNFAQSFEWINPYPVSFNYNPELVNICVSTDHSNNIYWGGMFMFHENYASAAYGDLNIIKHDANGEVITTFYAYGPANIVNMVHDNDDNLILIIDIRDDLLLDTSDTIFHSGNNTSSYLVKLSPDFDLLWTKMIADNFSYSVQKGITIDSDNNIYYGQDNFQDSHIIILNSNGEEIDSILQENVAMISSIAVDENGNIYIAGACPSVGATYNGVVYEPPFSYNIYLAKYNNQFEVQWVNYVEDVTCPFPEVIVSDPDHIYFVGELYINTMFGSIPVNGPNWVFDFYVARINPEGEFLWVNEVPESTVISGDASIGKFNSCTIDSENNICITGFIRGEVDWGNGMVTTSTDIVYDLLVVKYNDIGEVIMTKYGGGTGFDKAISGTIDSNDNLYVAGFGYDSTTFDDLETNFEGYYPFLLKLNSGNVSTDIQKVKSYNPLQVYPNPVSDIVHIKIEENMRTLRLLDINGSVLERIEVIGKTSMDLDLSQFSTGVYFLNILTIYNNQYRQKILKL